MIAYTCICTTIDGVEDAYIWKANSSNSKGMSKYQHTSTNNFIIMNLMGIICHRNYFYFLRCAIQQKTSTEEKNNGLL